MKKILVPTDFSGRAQTAIKFAFHLAKTFHAEITLVTAIRSRKKAGALGSLNRVLAKEATDNFSKLLRSLDSDIGEIPVHTKTLKGSPAYSISKYAKKKHFDLIVMCTQGASGMEEVFIGSTAGGVISKAQTPVFIIPTSFKYKPIQKICFAIGNLQISSPTVLAPLKKISKAYGAHIHALHLTKSSTIPSDRIRAALKNLTDTEYSVNYQANVDNVPKSIDAYMDAEDFDLLALIRRRKDMFDRLFSKSVTLKSTFQSKIPLLIMHN